MAEKMKIYKCAFKHCQHESCELSQDIAVKVGNRYMHQDCAKMNEYILKTKDLYYEKVSKTVVMSQLVNVINNIVFKKGVDPEYLYFALNYAIMKKITIKSPFGLHYIIDNKSIKDLWKSRKSNEAVRKTKEYADKATSQIATKNSFAYTASSTETGFGKIIGG